MRKVILFFGLFLAGTMSISAQEAADDNDSLGLPGDNFDLYAALEMFKSAASLEAFEESLNKKDNEINNLDLNEDGQVDYIQVIDQMEKDTHAIVLRVAVSETESQDVAVIGIEKTGENSAIVQITGDEDLYGADYIVEPSEEKEVEETGKGPSVQMTYSRVRPMFMIVNVWYWPCVQYVYVPAYRPWRSPWRWAYYPTWWNPWRPMGWGMYRARVVRYHMIPCRRVYVNRVHYVQRVYHPYRMASPTVHRRTEPARVRYAQRHAARPTENQQQRAPHAVQNSSAQTANSSVQRQQNQQNANAERAAPAQKATPATEQQRQNTERTDRKAPAANKANAETKQKKVSPSKSSSNAISRKASKTEKRSSGPRGASKASPR